MTDQEFAATPVITRSNLSSAALAAVHSGAWGQIPGDELINAIIDLALLQGDTPPGDSDKSGNHSALYIQNDTGYAWFHNGDTGDESDVGWQLLSGAIRQWRENAPFSAGQIALFEDKLWVCTTADDGGEDTPPSNDNFDALLTTAIGGHRRDWTNASGTITMPDGSTPASIDINQDVWVASPSELGIRLRVDSADVTVLSGSIDITIPALNEGESIEMTSIILRGTADDAENYTTIFSWTGSQDVDSSGAQSFTLTAADDVSFHRMANGDSFSIELLPTPNSNLINIDPSGAVINLSFTAHHGRSAQLKAAHDGGFDIVTHAGTVHNLVAPNGRARAYPIDWQAGMAVGVDDVVRYQTALYRATAADDGGGEVPPYNSNYTALTTTALANAPIVWSDHPVTLTFRATHNYNASADLDADFAPYLYWDLSEKPAAIYVAGTDEDVPNLGRAEYNSVFKIDAQTLSIRITYTSESGYTLSNIRFQSYDSSNYTNHASSGEVILPATSAIQPASTVNVDLELTSQQTLTLDGADAVHLFRILFEHGSGTAETFTATIPDTSLACSITATTGGDATLTLTPSAALIHNQGGGATDKTIIDTSGRIRNEVETNVSLVGGYPRAQIYYTNGNQRYCQQFIRHVETQSLSTGDMFVVTYPQAYKSNTKPSCQVNYENSEGLRIFTILESITNTTVRIQVEMLNGINISDIPFHIAAFGEVDPT